MTKNSVFIVGEGRLYNVATYIRCVIDADPNDWAVDREAVYEIRRIERTDGSVQYLTIQMHEGHSSVIEPLTLVIPGPAQAEFDSFDCYLRWAFQGQKEEGPARGSKTLRMLRFLEAL